MLGAIRDRFTFGNGLKSDKAVLADNYFAAFAGGTGEGEDIFP